MKAIIASTFWSGLGDSYSAYISAYTVSKYLEELGYDVTFVWDTTRCVYLPRGTKKVGLLFDESVFTNPIKYSDEVDYSGYILLEQPIKTLEIYLEKMVDELTDYRYELYCSMEITRRNLTFPYRDMKFLNQDVYDLAASLPKCEKAIHYRIRDSIVWAASTPELIDKTIKTELAGEIEGIENFIKTNKGSNILFCSNYFPIREEFAKKYPNVYYLDHQNKTLGSMWSADSYLDFDESVFIHRMKETLAEMVALSYPKDILVMGCSWYSSFLSYRLAHKNYEQ